MALENADTGAPRNPGGAKRDDFADFPRDQYGRPKIIRAELNPATGRWEVPRDAEGKLIKELIAVTRASTLGGAIEYQGGLHRWKSAVVAWGIARSRTLAKRARAVASYSRREDKDELYEIVDKAQAFAESDQAANHGTALHSVFRRIAEGETVDDLVASGAIDEEDLPACRAFAEAIEPWVVVFAERRVVCDEAQAAGKYDIVVTPRRPMPVTDAKGAVIAVIMPGDLVAVDNKTSSSADYFGEKFAVQLWVYANGRDYDPETGERTEVGVRKDWALILHIPSGSDEGTVAQWHWVNLELGGKLVKVARDVLEGRKLGKRAIVKADLDAEIPDEFLVRTAGIRAGTESVVALGEELADPETIAAMAEITGMSELDVEAQLAAEVAQLGKPECRCVTPTCPECLHIPGCVDAEDPVAWCEHEAGEQCPPGRPCRQRAHFPARCPGSGKTYAPELDPALVADVAEGEAAVAAGDVHDVETLGRPLGDADDHVRDAELAQTLAQRLQGAAALEATRSDRDRVRAYLVRQLPKAATLERLTDLWRRARKAGHWDRPDAELDPLFAARGAELKAAQARALEPAG